MAYWLVDYENVKVSGLDGLTSLTDKDTVCIFYSENSDSMTFGLHKRLMASRAEVQYQKVEVGSKNALDFQLSTYLGWLIKGNGNGSDDYYVVTKDQGFSVLSKYWARYNVNVQIVINCSGTNRQDEHTTLRQKAEQVLHNAEDVDIVVKLIENYKTKQGINNALVKHYKDGRKVKEIYTAIKPLIADKKGRD